MLSYAVCQAAGCGRALVPGLHDDEYHDWFVALNVETGRSVIRCPRHITRWSARLAGQPWTNEWRAWAAGALQHDLDRYTINPPGYNTPVPHERT